MLEWLTRRAHAALRRASRPLAYAPHDGRRGVYPATGGGAALPPGSPDWAVVEDRALQRHGWFSGLSRRFADTGDEAAAAQACDELARWLSADQPGLSPGWAHPSDASLRLVHWAIGVGALKDALDPALRRRIAGAARVHAQLALSELGHQPEDHRRVAHAAALALAGFGWPGLEEAPRLRSEGLSWLGRAFPGQVFSDGSPRTGSTASLRLSAQLAVLVRGVCAQGGGSLPASLPPALEGASFFLGALGETLPPFGDCPAESLGVPLGDAPEVPEKDWSLLTFREGGWVIARARHKELLSRVVVRAGEAAGPFARPDFGQVAWELGGVPILAESAASGIPANRGALPWPSSERLPPPSLTMARQDGREVRVVVERLGRRAEARRELVLTASRLVATDRFGACDATSLEWPLGAGLRPEATPEGWEAELPAGRLRVGFEGASARAAAEGFVLSVPAGLEVRVKSRFEVR